MYFLIVGYASKRDRSRTVLFIRGRKKENWVVNDFIGLINDHYLSLFELSQPASSSWPWCCVGWLAGIQNCHQPAHPLPIAIMKIVHFIFKTDPQRQVSRSLAHSRTLYEAPSALSFLENNQQSCHQPASLYRLLLGTSLGGTQLNFT